MSYVNIRLPDINELYRRLNEDDRWYKFYLKCDSFLGPKESIEFLTEQLEIYIKKNKKKIATL